MMKMNFKIKFKNDFLHTAPKVKVIGIGGGGGNAINTIIELGISPDIEIIAANKDLKDLEQNLAPIKIPLGKNIKSGEGAGGNPEEGRKAALETQDVIKKAIKGSDVLILVAGMGGGTGTGALPVIAKLAKEMGIFTLAVVTKPFSMEGSLRLKKAKDGIIELSKYVDSYFVIDNEALINYEEVTLYDGFKRADRVLYDIVNILSSLMDQKGYIRIDFADIKNALIQGGESFIGRKNYNGQDPLINAFKQAVENQLLNKSSIDGATNFLIYFNVSKNISMYEFKQATEYIKTTLGKDKTMFFGLSFKDDLDINEVDVIVIGSNYNSTRQEDSRIYHSARNVSHITSSNDLIKQRYATMSETKNKQRHTELFKELTLDQYMQMVSPREINDDSIPAIVRRRKKR